MKTIALHVTEAFLLCPGLTERKVLSCLNEVFTFTVLTGRRLGWGLEWGSIAAAQQRFVRDERMRGSIIIRGLHPAAIASRPQ